MLQIKKISRALVLQKVRLKLLYFKEGYNVFTEINCQEFTICHRIENQQ